MLRIVVPYRSARGHFELMANAAAEGACHAGVEAIDVRRVPELVPTNVA